MGVEGERRPGTAAGKLREDVEPVLEHAHALRAEALLLQPAVDRISDRAFPAGRALDVGEPQHEVDELFLVDQGEHGRRGLRVDRHRLAPAEDFEADELVVHVDQRERNRFAAG